MPEYSDVTYTIEICPEKSSKLFGVENRIDWPKHDEVDGYTIPIEKDGGTPVNCDFRGIKVLLEPEFADPSESVYTCQDEGSSISWYQLKDADGDGTDYWRFTLYLEGPFLMCVCARVGVFFGGNVTFGAEYQEFFVEEKQVTFDVHRSDLPVPGEWLYVYLAVPDDFSTGESQSYPYSSTTCAPVGDGFPGHTTQFTAPNGQRLVYLGGTWFCTPTWTGGKVISFSVDGINWYTTAGDCPSDYDIESDPDLRYQVRIHGDPEIIIPTDFAGYGVGDYVMVRRTGGTHTEPYDDSSLDVDGETLRMAPWRYPI